MSVLIVAGFEPLSCNYSRNAHTGKLRVTWKRLEPPNAYFPEGSSTDSDDKRARTGAGATGEPDGPKAQASSPQAEWMKDDAKEK